MCDELGATSLALPAISMGIYGYPADEGARIGIRVASDHLRGETSLGLVRFVLFSADTHEVFKRALADLS